MSERILVTGSREWSGSWEDIAVHFPEEYVTIIHGDCSRVVNGVQVSVDWLAGFAARGLGHAVERFPVDHTLDGPWPGAGPRRNARMLRDGKPDHGLAFGALWTPIVHSQFVAKPSPNYKHTGTGDMVKKLLAARIPTRWIASPSADAVDLTEMPAPPVP